MVFRQEEKALGSSTWLSRGSALRTSGIKNDGRESGRSLQAGVGMVMRLI